MENQSCFNWIIRNNFENADFWLVNKGSSKSLGNPVKTFESFYTGVQCPVLVWPDYGYYYCLYLYNSGFWKRYSKGSTGLQHLRVSDIRKVFAEISRQNANAYEAIRIKVTANNHFSSSLPNFQTQS